MRLIDGDLIYKAIPAEEDNNTGMGMTFDEMDAYNDGIDAMYRLIQGAPTVEAISKYDYENRLKADLVAMLTEILTDFDNQIEPNSTRIDCESIIEQKIQALEEKTDGEK